MVKIMEDKMTNKNYKELADKIIELVGGKENISYLAHCMTRLRFNLKDESAAKTDEIKNIIGLLGCQWVNGQLQIIVGQDVVNLYNEIIEKTGLEREDAINENLDLNTKKKKNWKELFGSVFSTIAGCVSPCIPTLIVSGLLTTVTSILTQFCGFKSDSNTIVVLNFVANAALYFLPIYIGANAAKKFGASPSLGMLMGGMLLANGWINAVSSGTQLSFFGIPMHMQTYNNTVLPVIMSCFVLSYVEKFFNKHIHVYLRSFVAPLLTVLVMIPVTFTVVAPIGSYLSTYIVDALVWFHDTTGPIGVGLVAMLYPLMVATGLHVAMSPIMVQTFSTFGYENLFYPAGCIGNTCQGFAALAVSLKTKNVENKSVAVSAAIPAILGKVTEPALYGVCLKYKVPEYCAMIGEFVGGVFAGIVGTKIYFFGGGGLLGFAGYIGNGGAWELPLAIAGLLIAGIITFILTYIFYSDEKCGVDAE